MTLNQILLTIYLVPMLFNLTVIIGESIFKGNPFDGPGDEKLIASIIVIASSIPILNLWVLYMILDIMLFDNEN